MKKTSVLITLLVCLLALSGCGDAGKRSKTADDVAAKAGRADKGQVKHVALVMKTLTNPFFAEMEKGARRAEQELGIELVVKSGAKETSIEQQIAIVEELIRDKIDAIVIAPGSSVELIPVLKKAQDADIPIVNIDNRLDQALSRKAGLVNVPFISVDNAQGAYDSAKYVCDRVTKKTKAGLLEGIRVARNAQDRQRGAMKAFKENKFIEVVASETANWKIDEAAEVARKMFTKHPDIGVLFCANDMMALGAIHYLEESGHKGVLVAAYDAIAEAKEALREGKLAVTIDQQADLQGYTGVKWAFEMIQGKKPPLEKIVGTRAVTRQNL